MERQTDIAIIGGGIAGAALALILAGEGLRVDLADPAAPPPVKDIKPTGRTAALFGSSVETIRKTGAWPLIEQYSNPMSMMRIIDEGSGQNVSADFEAGEIGKEQFGFNIPNGILRAALFETMRKNKNITLHVPNGFTGYEVKGNRVLINLREGKKINASLMIGADGRNSRVRELAGIGFEDKQYGQSALTFLINHSRAHNDTSIEFHRSGGPLALVPLPGNQSSIVWVEKTERAEELIRLKKQEFEQVFQSAIDEVFGGVTLATTPECWPLSAMKAKKLTVPRVALIAEAAHVMSPVAAQGLNLSLRDVSAIADLITKHFKLGLDMGAGALLKEYERQRRFDVNTRTFGVDLLNRMAGNDNAALQSARRLGLKIVDQILPLKKILMNQALNS